MYLTFKSLHLIAMVAFFAGIFYMPRLFVYHTRVAVGSETDLMFQEMERKLLKFIINPALITMWVFGLLMLYWNPAYLSQGWMHAKLLLVFLLSGFPGFLSVTMKKFAKGENGKGELFFRIINEVPTVFLILIIILAVFRPF